MDVLELLELSLVGFKEYLIIIIVIIILIFRLENVIVYNLVKCDVKFRWVENCNGYGYRKCSLRNKYVRWKMGFECFFFVRGYFINFWVWWRFRIYEDCIIVEYGRYRLFIILWMGFLSRYFIFIILRGLLFRFWILRKFIFSKFLRLNNVGLGMRNLF